MTQEIVMQMRSLASEEKAAVYVRFFKTGKGEYGEGDRFMGVTVPLVRNVAKRYREAPLDVLEELLSSEWHECRLCALLILVDQYRSAYKSACLPETERLYEFYLSHVERINNWDLVDLSAPYIVGVHLLTRNRDILYHMVQSKQLWEQRIAVVGTLGLIRQGEYKDTLRLADYLSAPERRPLHDLMQKATGWMLREVGKRDVSLLVDFLSQHASFMPRTMLRYSIEKFPPQERKRWLLIK